MKKVLVVDDSLYMRTMISDALIKSGYEIVAQAANGESAIAMALEHKPDLITLDNILPDMIGIDILRVLKQENNIESKIIMISAVGQELVVKEGMSLGASNYIVKPFTAQSLVEEVNKVFQ
ncbi:MAG: response regulator [Bacteroidetes bacterium HGW-Bacteroidetes-21]|jgi:two-component system chemotaxis response regulator CheY|nr:MAG: response regulator [Bacteroidetes bacterium HGW-Bacteroidetes-21]